MNACFTLLNDSMTRFVFGVYINIRQQTYRMYGGVETHSVSYSNKIAWTVM